MSCEYCKCEVEHLSSCPNADEPIYEHECSICGEGIYEGEQYVLNDDGEYAHYDCPSMKELIDFLGYEILTMRGDDY